MRRRPLSCFCLLLILLIFLGTVTGMTGRTDKEWDEKGCTLTGRRKENSVSGDPGSR